MPARFNPCTQLAYRLLGTIAKTAGVLALTLSTRAQQTTPDLGNLSLESLSAMQITSVARKQQNLSDAAAAVFVITREDIRRSGASNIAEALRLVPGLDVAQIDANKWAVTTRGFNERYADRTLIMIDGRSVYSPLTSGVNWDAQETMLNDIDRIEVIRGPGATMWGANAMNGVINIITSNAGHSLGGLLVGRISIQDKQSGALRYGGRLGTSGSYRLYARYLDRMGTARPSGETAPDDWQHIRGGFRADWKLSQGKTFNLQGDIYTSRTGGTATNFISLSNPLGAPFADRQTDRGGDVLSTWTRSGEQVDTRVQFYFENVRRDQSNVLSESRQTFDLDTDQHYRAGTRNEASWGFNFRDNIDHTDGSFGLSFMPANRNLQLYGAYVQDEVTLIPARLKLTAGSKVEHSFYNGFAIQPNVRAILTASRQVAIWGSIGRAAATPSRIDTDVRFNEALVTVPGVGTVLYSHFGTAHLPPEAVVAYETGVRYAAHPKLSLDLATFVNHYSSLHTTEPGTPFMETAGMALHLVIPDYVSSNNYGTSRGAELLVTAPVTRSWKLSASYTAMLMSVRSSSASMDYTSAGDSESSSPRHQFQIHSMLNLPGKTEFDTALYYVGSIANGVVPSYTRLDLRLAWHVRSNFEVDLGGHNLLQAYHYEFDTDTLAKSEAVTRSAYIRSTWRF